jgi:hypothetical protein
MLIRPYFLFALERYVRVAQSIRKIGGVIIALDDPIYVGRLLIGADEVEDRSDLIVPGRTAQNILRELQQIRQQPGADVTRDHGDLYILFDEPTMTERSTRATFIRDDTYTSFVRQPGRHERVLREFVSELSSRQPTL